MLSKIKGDLFFEYVKEGKLSDGTRVREMLISMLRSDDGTTGPLVVTTDTCFSSGIEKDSEYGGYYIPLTLMGTNSSAKRQKEFVRVIKEIRSACGEPISESRLYDEGGIVICAKIDNFLTRFYERETIEDEDSEKEITPEKYVGKICVARAIIEISGVFVAKEAIPQMKAKTIIFSEVKPRKKLESPSDEI